MTKSFVDKLKDAAVGEGNPDDWPDYSELAEKLIAIDDIVTEYIEFTNFTENAQANGVLKQIRQILKGATK